MPVDSININDISQNPPPSDVEDYVRSTAKKYNLDPDIFARMAHQESGFNQNALSTKGAIGVMQLMPSTAAGLNVDPHDVYQNIEGGAKYFRQMLDRYKGDTNKALAAYNAGPAKIDAGVMPNETVDYVNRITGKSPAVPTQPPININAFQDYELPSVAKPSNVLTEANPYLAKYGPDVLGMITTALAGPEIGIPAGALAASIGRGAVGAAEVQQGQSTPEEAARNVRNTAIGNLLGGFGGRGLQAIGDVSAPWVYRKVLGVGPQQTREMQAVNDMVEKDIPLGLGFYRKLGKLKDNANDALNEIYDKYIPKAGKQVPGLVKTGVAGQASAQQGASATTAAANVIRKSDIARDLAQYYASDPTIPQPEIQAAGKALDDFMGRMGDEISFKDARKIKQALQLKPPYGQETEGMQQARKVVAHTISENIAKNIPDVADRAKFLASNRELEKLVNIEELKGLSGFNRRLMSYAMAVPIAGALAGGASGYYTHFDPSAALLRAGIAGALVGPTAQGGAVNLLRSPWAGPAAARLAISRGFEGEQSPTGPAMSEAERQRMLKFLNEQQ